MGECEMSRNGFAECEREYNRREEAIEMAKDQREPAEDSHLSGQADRPEIPTLRSQQEVSAQSGSRAQFLLRQARLCIDPFENPDMAEEIDDYLKGDKHERDHHQAAYDLLRECRAMLDGLEAQPLIYRIDAAIKGEKK
jgi:hypothetical protein